MSKENIMSELQQIFRDLFDNNQIVLNEKFSSADLEEWDSIEHINLILQIEKHFGIRIEMTEVVELNAIENIINIIQNRISCRS